MKTGVDDVTRREDDAGREGRGRGILLSLPIGEHAKPQSDHHFLDMSSFRQLPPLTSTKTSFSKG